MVTARIGAALVAAALAGLGAVLPPLPAVGAQPECSTAPASADPIPELPWAQQWFAPERVWPLSRGRGVVVAVLDSGVDTGHPQLAGGQVLTGVDLLPEPAGAHVDCSSHGTAVASIIAASQTDGVGFAGLAPGAEILPVRVAERSTDPTGPDQESTVDAGTFAAALRWAAEHGADVINASVVFSHDHPAIAGAVRAAVGRGIVVVAAVGNPRPEDSGEELTPYPAAYPGVVGVGAIGPASPAGGEPVLAPVADAIPHVDLVAPGVAVTAAAAGGGHGQVGGSSYAAPFVSAAAALVRAADPDLTGAEVIDRLFATADPGPGPAGASGHGVVNPYRALTERVVDAGPVAVEAPVPAPADPVAQARSRQWQRAGELAVLAAAGAAGIGALGLGGRALWRRGRRRGWRPARQPPVGAPPESTADTQQQYFTVPTVRRR